MHKVVLWVLGLAVAIPVALVALVAFVFFAVFPAMHAWNLHRMEGKNDQVWENATARVVTVETQLGTKDNLTPHSADIICYEGYYATPWTLKDGGPKTGFKPMSVGFEALQAPFPTGATLDISLRFLCGAVFRTQTTDLPFKYRFNQMDIVAEDLQLTCRFNNLHQDREFAFETDAGRAGHPYIVAIDERPLRNVATRADMGSAETPSVSSGFTRRWEWALGKGRSYWRADSSCWTNTIGRCNDALTQYCGKNPR